MEVSQIERPFDKDGDFTDQDDAIRSLLFFESLMSWKRREIDHEKMSKNKPYSIGGLYGPSALLQQHYSHYLEQSVHLTSPHYMGGGRIAQ